MPWWLPWIWLSLNCENNDRRRENRETWRQDRELEDYTVAATPGELNGKLTAVNSTNINACLQSRGVVQCQCV